jgi:hypothetical protein
MNSERIVREARAANTTKQDVKAQLAQYLAQQPVSKQRFHKWMKVLEMASLAIVVGAFAVAMYVSINWTMVPLKVVPTAWVAFPVSLVPLMILIGLHTIVLKAFLPIVVPGESQTFVTGSKAEQWGRGLIVSALLVGAFWGVFAWVTWAYNPSLILTFSRFLLLLVPVGIAATILQIVRSR